MAFGRKDWIEINLAAAAGDTGKKENIIQAPEAYEFHGSSQSDMRDKSGVWPILEIWAANNYFTISGEEELSHGL